MYVCPPTPDRTPTDGAGHDVTKRPYRAGVSTIDEAAAFLRGAGLHYARRQLRERRLPTALVEDVVQEALVAVLRAVEAGREIDNVEAYVTRVVRNVVVDFVRGKANRPEAALLSDDDVDPFAEVVDEGALPEGDVLAAEVLVDLRDAVSRRLAGDALAAAGALAVLAHRDPSGGATPADDCPQPRGGATPDEAASWIGLFYAGRRGWFVEDDDGADTPAIRQRRSRWARAQTAVLADAADEVGLHAGGRHG